MSLGLGRWDWDWLVRDHVSGYGSDVRIRLWELVEP